MDREAVRRMVRRVVYRTLGMPEGSEPVAPKLLVTESWVRDTPRGGTLAVPPGALITPLARQVALERRISLDTTPSPTVLDSVSTQRPGPSSASERTIAVGADHGGYELKEALIIAMGEQGYSVVDCGTDSTASVDYPDFAFAVARLVAQGRAWRGIVVDGAGIGSCMVANKVPGVRAAMCYDQATAVNSRAHNDANVLTLGAGLIGPSLARQIVMSWLETPSSGGRHQRRVDKIMQIEQRFLKGSADG